MMHSVTSVIANLISQSALTHAKSDFLEFELDSEDYHASHVWVARYTHFYTCNDH